VSPSYYGMFSGFRTYFSCVVLLFIDRSSIPVAFLLVFDVCGVICGVFSVLYLLFCSFSCCLNGDISLLGFDRSMFVDLKKISFLLRLEVRFGLVTCGDKRKRAIQYRIVLATLKRRGDDRNYSDPGQLYISVTDTHTS
jgi:hypothetical protein